MGFFRKIVQRLSIEFYSKFEAGINLENPIQAINDSLIIYYFLTYYAKILYNLGKGEDSYYLVKTIIKGLENALAKKSRIGHNRIVEFKGKGKKSYVAQWDKKGSITTKIAWGQEGEYAPDSVFLFLNHLFKTLPEDSCTKLFFCVSEFHKLMLGQEPPERLGWSQKPIP